MFKTLVNKEIQIKSTLILHPNQVILASSEKSLKQVTVASTGKDVGEGEHY